MCLITSTVMAQPLMVEGQSDTYSLSGHVLVFDDWEQSMTVQQIASLPRSSFRAVDSSALTLGSTRGAHWVRIVLRTTADAQPNWYLEADCPIIHDVRFYVPKPDGELDVHQMGLNSPYSARVIDSPTFIVPLNLPLDRELTVHVRIAGEYSLAIPFNLYSDVGLARATGTRELGAGLYYGLVLVMVLYNLLLYFSLRDKHYLYYVFTLLFLHLLYQSAYLGHFYQYVATDNIWFASRCLPFFVAVGSALGLHFSRSFLHSAQLMPRLDKGMLGFAAGHWVVAALALAAPPRVAATLLIPAGSAPLLIIICAAQSWRRGYAPAGYFLVAWTALLVGGLALVLRLAGVLPATFFTTYGVQLGCALEVFLLSLALGARINVLRSEREAAQRLALEKEQEAAEAQSNLVNRLQQMDQLKDRILANTSHELRTPLNGISGLAESMMDGAAGILPQKANEDLSMIVASARRLTSLVGDILDFSSMRRGDLALRIAPTNLADIVEAVFSVSRPLIGSKRVVLRTVFPPDLPTVAADPDRLHQILLNLVGNAIKFTNEGSIEISARADGASLQVQVADTGIGIAPQNLEKIFEAFEQGDGSVAQEYGGTGLGLAVSRKLVELLGGQLSVRSVVGRGSSFLFALPISTERPASFSGGERVAFRSDVSAIVQPPPLEKPSVNEPALSAKILVVDDEPVNQTVLSNILGLQDCSVIKAMSGAEGLEALEREKGVELVLLDVMMPQLSGYEVCRQIRAKHSIAELPVLMLTAKTQISDLLEGFNCGANDYVTKPFSKRELISRLRTHLQLARITRAADRFVPHEFLSLLKKKSLADVKLGDRIMKAMTVMFSDLRSYTTMSETMSPEENFEFINRYFGLLAPVIREHHGFIDKYIGDSIMALFSRSTVDAVAAAVDMQRFLRELNGKRLELGQAMVGTGIGINTGNLMLGTIGHAERLQSTALSDAVNVAARLEQLTKIFRAPIIISEATRDQCANESAFHSRRLGWFSVKGRAQPVAIYEVLDGYGEDVMALKLSTCDEFEKGVEAWQRGDVPTCASHMGRVLEINAKDQAAILYSQRCDSAGTSMEPHSQLIGGRG